MSGAVVWPLYILTREVASAIADLPMLAEGDVRTSKAATFQYVGFGTNDVGEQFTT